MIFCLSITYQKFKKPYYQIFELYNISKDDFLPQNPFKLPVNFLMFNKRLALFNRPPYQGVLNRRLP